VAEPKTPLSHGPIQGPPVEAVLATNTAKRAIFVGPVLIAVFWLLRDVGGAIGATLGVAVVVVNFLAAGWILSISARVSLSLYHAAALFGFFVRLGLITLSVVLIATVYEDLDRMAFGISVVVAYLVLLTWEAISVARGNERELEWTS